MKGEFYMWKCKSCGFVNGEFNKLNCKKCNAQNPQYTFFGIEQTKNVKKHIYRLFNNLNKTTDALCEVRDDWQYRIEKLEESLPERKTDSNNQEIERQLSELRDVTRALDDYISISYTNVEEPLEKLTYRVDSCIEMDEDWETPHLKLEEVIPVLKKCVDGIYPLISHAESINSQRRGISNEIKRLSKFALDLQNTIDILYVEVPKKEFVKSRGLSFEILDCLLVGENDYFCVAKEEMHSHLFVFHFIENFENYQVQIVNAINNIPQKAFEFLENSLYEYPELCIRIAYNPGESTGFELYDNLYNSGYIDDILTTKQLLEHLGSYRNDIYWAFPKYYVHGSRPLFDDYRNAIKEEIWGECVYWKKNMIIPNVVKNNLSIEMCDFNQYFDDNTQCYVNECIALHQRGVLYFYEEAIDNKTGNRLDFINNTLEKISSEDFSRIVELLRTNERCDINGFSYYPIIKIIVKYDNSISYELYECDAWKLPHRDFEEWKTEINGQDTFFDLYGNEGCKSKKLDKVFSCNLDIRKNAYMNWRTDRYEPIHNLNTLAQGYFENAILSIKACLADNIDRKADILIFPILFSINHAIELYEKSICWSLNILLGFNTTYKSNHDIRGIWYTVKQKAREFGFGYGREEEVFMEMIIPLEKYLDEIYQNIMTNDFNKAYHNIDFSRYPINNHEDNHFYINQYDNVVVDLENLLEWSMSINDCLSRLAGTYYSLVLEKSEMQTQ